MAGGDDTDTAGKYTLGGGGGGGPTGINRWWPSIIKVFELLLAIVCIGLIDEPASNARDRPFVSQRTIALAYATFATYLIFPIVYLIGKFIRDSWPWKTTALLSFVGFILFLATCAATLSDWGATKERNFWPPNTQRLDLLCAAGFMSLATSLVHLVDGILTVRAGINGDLD